MADCVDYAVWEGGAHWNDHSYDENWVGASGPSECGNVVAESVQSVATATVDGYPNGVVVAASPHIPKIAMHEVHVKIFTGLWVWVIPLKHCIPPRGLLPSSGRPDQIPQRRRVPRGRVLE